MRSDQSAACSEFEQGIIRLANGENGAGVGVEGDAFRIIQPVCERVEVADLVIAIGRHPVEDPIVAGHDAVYFAVNAVDDVQNARGWIVSQALGVHAAEGGGADGGHGIVAGVIKAIWTRIHLVEGADAGVIADEEVTVVGIDVDADRFIGK